MMTRLGARLVACVSLLAILGGCTCPPDPMTFNHAVRVRQDGLCRIRAFFDNNPSDPNCIDIYLLGYKGGGSYDTRLFWNVTDNSLDCALVKELIEALRDRTEPISERLPVYQAKFCFPWGYVVVAGRDSALVITIEESGAHVGGLTGLFVNKPFFHALERFVVQKEIITKDEYYWAKLAPFRKAAGELSLNAYVDHSVINSAEALEKAGKMWPPGALDSPSEDPLFPDPRPQTRRFQGQIRKIEEDKDADNH